jgi:RNA polymerase sigma factor (sigma-70 family)
LNQSIENNPTEQQLVTRVLNGDNNAFSVIIKNTESLVAQIVFKMIGHSGDRKDLAQDIYLKAFKNLPGFRFESKLSTWVATIAYNTCINHLEKEKTIPRNDFRNNPDELAVNPHLPDRYSGYPYPTDPENRLIRKELSKMLAGEIEMLSPVYKTLITLYHNEEMSYEEIGSITGLPSGTVKSYLFRARKSLKENILNKYKREEI